MSLESVATAGPDEQAAINLQKFVCSIMYTLGVTRWRTPTYKYTATLTDV